MADNRDIFDKALDVVVPAAGAVAGGIVGRRLGGSKKGMKANRARGNDATRKRDKLIDNPSPKVGDVGEGMYQQGRRDWAYGDANRTQNNRIGGAMIGGASGTAGGMVLRGNDHTGKRKR